jgi:hypothetical protein
MSRRANIKEGFSRHVGMRWHYVRITVGNFACELVFVCMWVSE